MRKRFQTLALTLFVCALLSPVAFAGVKTKMVTFNTDVKIGETLVKKGTYKASFDDKANELTILNGKKVIAKITASLKDLKGSSSYEAKYTTEKDKNGISWLTGVNVGGKLATINADKADNSPASAVQ
ncbi:MAG: hypothetical protein QOJ02_1214 [Acidobacteriota bacterium]|jgi:hypothetical protein|nr:hypothetical protein [Acidobacteriota bacterium]